MFQVKSFIETQRALLTEIQNGCKRNFILAKEKEETEEKMKLSASMAEIATEDGTREEEEDVPASAERKEGEEEGEPAENALQTDSRSETSPDTTAPPENLDSDSDTEDEDEGEVVTKSSPVVSNQAAPVSQPPLSASRTPSPHSASPTRAPALITGITVTESAVPAPPGTPPSPGRCISVSSPGRGHKIFMVTRVESPPEQLQKAASPWPPKYSTTLTPVQTQLTPEGANGSPPAPSTDNKTTEETPGERLGADSPKLDPLSSEDAKARTLDPAGLTDPSQPTPALPSNSSPLPDVALKPTSPPDGPPQDPTATEGSNKAEEHEGKLQDGGQGPSTNELAQPTPAQEELNTDQTAGPGESPPPNPTDDEPSREEMSPDPVQTSQQAPSSSNPPEDGTDVNPGSQVKDQESSDENSADECFVEALDGEVVASALPNGLKTEFSLHLLDGETPKPGSCVMEHGESLLLFG